MLDAFREQLDRTGLSVRRLGLHIMEHEKHLLPPEVIRRMMQECPLPELKDHYSVLTDILKQLPNAPVSGFDKRSIRSNSARIPFTPDMQKALNQEFERTQLNTSEVCRRLFPKSESSKQAQKVWRIRNENAESVDQTLWNTITDYLKSVPSASS